MIQLAPDLLSYIFVLFAAAIVATLAWLAIALIGGRPAWTPARTLGAVIAAYALLLIAGSVTSIDRRVPLGTTLCFGEWCPTVTRVRRAGTGSDRTRSIAADVLVQSVAKRVTMRPSDPRLFFIDAKGVWYRAEAADAPYRPIDDTIAAGERFTTRVTAEVPSSAKIVALRMWEGGWPDRIVPFSEESPFHGKTFYAINSSE